MTTGLVRASLLCICLTAIGAASTGPDALIAHWTFDELTGGTLKNEVSPDLDARTSTGLMIGDGVVGKALWLEGPSAVRVKSDGTFSHLGSPAISAWVRPIELSGYREIFRKEDGDKRLLFSFQLDGHILSLGLNTEGAGYRELDAKIDPSALMDGQWYNVAGTHDGRNTKVYLDGLIIGSEKRTGRILSGGPADAFIGSSGGVGEHFQGAIDDLRLFNRALTAETIARQYEKGLLAICPQLNEYRRQGKTLYQARTTFAETIAATRARLLEETPPSVLVRIVQSKLAANFPKAYTEFVEIAGGGAAAYLTTRDNAWNLSQAQRVMDLATEYKPRTERQWAGLSAGERTQWHELEALEARFAKLKAEGQAGTCDPAWIDLIIEAGRRIAWRPMVYEPVAPYVKPYTPPTRDYSASEAEELLERDWLYQADNAVTVERIRSECCFVSTRPARRPFISTRSTSTARDFGNSPTASTTTWTPSTWRTTSISFSPAREDTITFAACRRPIRLRWRDVTWTARTSI